MSDSEDDYMSFKVLNECEQDVRPSLLFNREKRKHEIYKKKLETVNKKRKTLGDLEKESREKGLSTAIPNDNKGFKLLEKMGFKPGESLGKTRSGIKEPIDIVIKQGTSGVGRESHTKEIINKKQQQKLLNLKQYETNFKLANREKKILSLVRKDFFKAQGICEELDYRNNIKEPVQEFFWTKDTIKKLRKSKLDEEYPVPDTDSSDEDDDDEFEQYVTEDNLFTIIDYLRKKHLYCLYCIITGIDEEDLKENCPGPYRRDHEDDIE